MSKDQMGKVTKSLEMEEDDDKDPNSALFTDKSYKLGDSGIEWSKIYQLFEEGTFEEEHDLDDFEDAHKVRFAQGSCKTTRLCL